MRVTDKHNNRGVWPITDDGKLVITQSMVSSFAECPREVYYSSVLGLRPRIESKPLTRGTWIHSLLEARANGEDWKAVHEDILHNAMSSQFDEEVEALAKECYDIVDTYDWVYSQDELKPIRAELTVERPLFNGKALYRGRIDLIVEDSNGNIWLVDHKTHANLPDWRYRELAFQHYSYLWACRKSPQYLELGIPQPTGFIYDYCRTNAIKEPTLTQKGNISRTVKATSTSYPVLRRWLIENNLMANIQGEDMIAVEDPKERQYIEDMLHDTKHRDYSTTFRRDFMKFTPSQERRQLKAFLTTAKRMLKYNWSDPDTVERNLHACSGFMCNYKDLTVADLVHGDSTLEQKTRYTRTDDPLDYYPNQKKEEKK